MSNGGPAHPDAGPPDDGGPQDQGGDGDPVEDHGLHFGSPLVLETIETQVSMAEGRFDRLELKASLLLAVETFLLLLLYGLEFTNALLFLARIASWITVGLLLWSIWPRDTFFPRPFTEDHVQEYKDIREHMEAKAANRVSGHELEEELEAINERQDVNLLREKMIGNWGRRLQSLHTASEGKQDWIKWATVAAMVSFTLAALGLSVEFWMDPSGYVGWPLFPSIGL